MASTGLGPPTVMLVVTVSKTVPAADPAAVPTVVMILVTALNASPNKAGIPN